MKYALQTPTPLIILFLAGSLCAAPAQNGQPPLRGAMVPGQPVPPPPAAVSPAPPGGIPALQNQPFPAIDLMIGLPIPQFEWKDPNWEDPNKLVKEINYPDLPIRDVADDLKKLFEDAFDVLLPDNFGEGRPNSESANWLDMHVKLQLKNVKASEIFNAMNLLFENNRTPLRWELKMNGTRRTALLRVLADPAVPGNNGRPETTHVFFVGDLIGDPKTGGMSMSQIVDTVAQVSKMAYGQTGSIQFHEQAQLLIVKGSLDQVSLIQQTIQALNMKASAERQRKLEAEMKSRTADALKAVELRRDESLKAGGGAPK